MSIWIVNQYATTPDMPNGARHYDLAQELVRLGHPAWSRVRFNGWVSTRGR